MKHRKFLSYISSLGFLLGLVMPSLSYSQEETRPFNIIAFGDSLVAGYQLPAEDAFPAKLEKALKAKGYKNVVVLNRGVSGDTTADAKARVQDVLNEAPGIVILEFGANDMFQKVPPAQVLINMEGIIKQLVAKGHYVLLTGMKAPPQVPIEYRDPFEKIYPVLAKKYNLAYYPFFLEGVANIAKYNQPDGVHPTADGVDIIVKGIMPTIEEMFKKLVERQG